MTQVFKCPACDGFCKRVRREGGKMKRCRACDGSGIITVRDNPVCTRPHYPMFTPYWQPYWNGITYGETSTGIYVGDTSAGDVASIGGVTYTTLDSGSDLSTLTGWNVS